MAELSPAPPPSFARARRVWRWVALALIALLATLALCVLTLLNQLSHPWVKSKVAALVLDNVGYEIDYTSAELNGLTLVIDGLNVRAAKAVRALAPSLLTAERLTAQLSFSAPQLPLLEVERPVLTVLVDEQGRTSFDTPPSKGAPTPETPLSEQARSLLGQSLPLRVVRVNQLSAAFLQSDRGRIDTRDALHGLSLQLDATPVADGTRLAVRTHEAPVLFTHAATGEAKGTLALSVDATANELALRAHVKITQQNLVPKLQVSDLARVEAHVSFGKGSSAIELRELEVGDGAATSTARLTMPDQGAPQVHEAHGDVDAVHLLELASPWLPDVKLRTGKLHYRVEDFRLDRPATQARLTVDGELEGLEQGKNSLGHAKLALKAQPADAALQIEGTASLDHLNAEDARLDDVSLQLAGTQNAKGVLAGEVTLRFAVLEQAIRVRNGSVVLHARDLIDVLSQPRGDLNVEATLGSVELPDLTATALELRAHALLRDEASVEGTVRAGSVRIPKLQLPVRADFKAKGSSPEAAHVELDALLGELSVKLNATRRDETLDYDLSTRAPNFTPLKPWLDDAMSLEMASTLHSAGKIERLTGQPRIKHKTELRLTNAAAQGVRTRSLELDLDGQGDALRHQLRADLHLQGLQYGEHQRDHERVQLTLAFDRVKPSLELALQTESKASLKAKLAVDHGVLDYDVAGQLADLAALEGLLVQSNVLAGFDVSKLGVEINSRGRLTGVIRRADARGIELMDDPLRTLGGEGTLAIKSTNFRWAQGNIEVSVPSASLNAKLRGEGPRRTIESEARATDIDGALGTERIRIAEAHDQTKVSLTGGIKDGVVEHDQRVWIRGVEQQVAGGYAVGDIEGSLRARRDAAGLIKLEELRVDNSVGGTRLSVSGGLQLDRDEQRLSVRTQLEQDLSRLPKFFDGQGKLAMDVTVSSSDFRYFHSAAKLKLAGVTVRLPKQNIALESMDGDLPIVSDFLINEDGVELLRGAHVNPYAAQRFSDQHPALGYRSFMSIARIKTPYFSCAPFAANLEVARNIVSLSQVELGARGGVITGSGMLEYDGLDSRIEANLRASNVLSSHKEPFDGNAALSIDVRERSVEGRADILRIGRQHLRDLLDLQDPLHADSGINAIRTALRFGYPDRVKLSFQHGFANAGVEFGGLARLVKLNDIRGIPIGPLVERIMSSIQPEQGTP